MKTNYETYTESNYSSYLKDSNQKNSSGYYPFLKFNESLYNKCQSKFSEFASHKKNDLKLLVNSQTKEKISIKDFLENSSNDINKLTPIPFINKRKIKNEGEKKDLKNLERNVVLMRRLEYANKIKEKNLKKKYNNKIRHIIFLQKMARGYLVRKVIYQVNIISDSLKKFFFLIKVCVWKKYFYIFKYNISQIWVNIDIKEEPEYKRIKMHKNIFKENKDEENEDNNDKTLDIGKNNNYLINVNEINNSEVKKEEDDTNYININLENENDINNISRKSMQFINEQLEKIKNQNVININNNIKKNIFKEKNNNDVNNSGKKGEKSYNNMFENYINASNKNSKNFFNFENNLPLKNNYKAKVIFIQRYFRKFLFQKEFYGKLGLQKVGFFLLKNIIINYLCGYAFNILKLLYQSCKNDITQEEDFIQLDSERIEKIKEQYTDACEGINFK